MLPRFPVPKGNPSSSSLLCESAICNSISPLTDHPDVVDLRGRVNSKLGRPGGGDGNDCLVSMDVAGAEFGVVGVSGREGVPILLKCGRIAV
jgi:hypothetical protein